MKYQRLAAEDESRAPKYIFIMGPKVRGTMAKMGKPGLVQGLSVTTAGMAKFNSKSKPHMQRQGEDKGGKWNKEGADKQKFTRKRD